jgi:hypothetical protein
MAVDYKDYYKILLWWLSVSRVVQPLLLHLLLKSKYRRPSQQVRVQKGFKGSCFYG